VLCGFPFSTCMPVFLLSVFLIIAILIGVRLYLSIFLMLSDGYLYFFF
jgi:hypothetical protein